MTRLDWGRKECKHQARRDFPASSGSFVGPWTRQGDGIHDSMMLYRGDFVYTEKLSELRICRDYLLGKLRGAYLPCTFQ